ncbi:MAG: N-acetyl-gamma-glutamyl-phosphate reductase [Phycisphaerales bacterium]
MTNHRRKKAVVIGAAGYSGRECCALLLGRDDVALVGVFGSDRRSDAPSLADLHPRLRGATDLEVLPTSIEAVRTLDPDVVFLATPTEASLDLAAALCAEENAPVVIDLSAAFRLKDTDAFQRHYKLAHPAPALLERAVYGLPERSRAAIAKAQLIASPGCYPTASVLAIAPLAGAGAITPGSTPIIDAVSGVSGAGRGANERTAFCEVSLAPYAVLSHRHQPEIDAYAGIETLFTPHLGAFERGILATIHIELAPDWHAERVRAAYTQAYAGQPFVQILDAGVWPSVAGVVGTNRCDIAFASDERRNRIVIASAIDNLLKGAAGQAVQSMNIRLGLPETAGLRTIR